MTVWNKCICTFISLIEVKVEKGSPGWFRKWRSVSKKRFHNGGACHCIPTVCVSTCQRKGEIFNTRIVGRQASLPLAYCASRSFMSKFGFNLALKGYAICLKLILLVSKCSLRALVFLCWPFDVVVLYWNLLRDEFCFRSSDVILGLSSNPVQLWS